MSDTGFFKKCVYEFGDGYMCQRPTPGGRPFCGEHQVKLWNDGRRIGGCPLTASEHAALDLAARASAPCPWPPVKVEPVPPEEDIDWGLELMFGRVVQ